MKNEKDIAVMKLNKGAIEEEPNSIRCQRISGSEDLISSVSKNTLNKLNSEEEKCNEKNFQCKRCDKSFKEIRTLRLHLKIHSADYPEQCEVCKKGFRTKWQLKQHLMDHGGKRPYPCPECSFTCKTKQQLNEHRRKHSGEKAYSCALCGTRFTYRNGLIKHTKLNRCPKKQIAPDGEKFTKKKSKNLENLKIQNPDTHQGLSSNKEEQIRKTETERKKIIDIVQNWSGMKAESTFEKNGLSSSLENLLTTQETKTFLTNSSDISSWAATLPAGTKVTVTHYDASKSSYTEGSASLVATPTHTETIIVTPPKTDFTTKSQMNFVPGTKNQSMFFGGCPLMDPMLVHPSHFEPFAIDPKETLLNSKATRQEFPPPNFNHLKMSPFDVQRKAKELLMNVKPDPIFDPNITIKSEFSNNLNSNFYSKISSDFVSESQICQEPLMPNPNLNDIKKEVLEELFDLHDDKNNVVEKREDIPSFLVPQLSNASENEESIVENAEFFTGNFEPKGSKEKLDFDISNFNFDVSNYIDEHMNISDVNIDENNLW